LEDLYVETQQKAKQFLYQLMKNQDIPLLKYTFRFFFDYYVDENKILVLPHHFSGRKIEGLTIIDELGVSISYEQENPITKQNFTLCHELGHFLLKHESGYFSESVDNQDSHIEREANIFSAFILMPDIVLLSKIYYACYTFEEVQVSLGVSKEALAYRLIDLLREYHLELETEIRRVVDEYIDGQNATIHHCFHKIKDQIADDFNQYRPSPVDVVIQKLSKSSIVTSEEVSELLNQEIWSEITDKAKYIKVWLLYNRGKSIAYAWDKNKLSEEQAKKKAEFKLLLI
jgi:hypothetical protein